MWWCNSFGRAISLFFQFKNVCVCNLLCPRHFYATADFSIFWGYFNSFRRWFIWLACRQCLLFILHSKFIRSWREQVNASGDWPSGIVCTVHRDMYSSSSLSVLTYTLYYTTTNYRTLPHLFFFSLCCGVSIICFPFSPGVSWMKTPHIQHTKPTNVCVYRRHLYLCVRVCCGAVWACL